MILRLAAIFVIVSSYSFGQSPDRQTSSLLLLDTGRAVGHPGLDSIRYSAAAEFNSIKQSYDSVMATADKQTSSISRKFDSLQNLHVPEEYLSAKLDSIERWRIESIDALKNRVESLKSGVTEKINTLKLPAGLEEERNKLADLVDNLDVSSPASGMPLNDNLQVDLPGLENPLGDQTFPVGENINLAGNDLNGVGVQINEYQSPLADFPANMEEASSRAEEQATKIPEMNEIGNQLSEAGKVTEMPGSLPDQQAIKNEIAHQARQHAVDHFQGKEEQLQKAMETVSKYKKKYSSAQSIEDLARKRHNPMKDKPFIERLVPGIALQIHRKDSWMVDFNLYSGYRFSPRLTAGAGWNQRIAYDADEYDFEPDLRIYGPRTYGEFTIGEGFSARLEMEYMNTRVPPQFSSGQADANGREWIFSALAGIKKEYRFLKNVKGTMMLLHNLHDPHHRSPYVDKLMVRFGFEFPMKKKTKSNIGII